MPPPTTIPARAPAGTGAAALRRGRTSLARACLALGVFAAVAAGSVAAGAGPAAAAPAVLYAAVTSGGTRDCSSVENACTLTTALQHVAPGQTIELITPGGDSAASRYVGNWTVGTSNTTATAPVTIEAAPGLASQPVLDGDGPHAPSKETCSTAACNGPVLTVPSRGYVALSGITIANSDNTTTGLGGGLENAGTVTITASTFIGNTAGDGGAIDSGNGLNTGGGTVTVTASTFSGNTATHETRSLPGDGGAIDSGDNGGAGSVTVTASTFSGNTGVSGGAIDSGDSGGGSVTVTASTFSDNTATNNGGAIDSGDEGSGGLGPPGSGLVTVTGSTFSGNTATNLGGTIDNGGSTSGSTGDATVAVAGDVFDGSASPLSGACAEVNGPWTDGGYNAGSDASCFGQTPATGDVNAGSAAALHLGPLASNGGPTKTIAPQTTSPVSKAVRVIPDSTTVTLGGSQVVLCPATDQRGYASGTQTKCDAGAVQTSGRPPLRLKDSARPSSFNTAGQVITYSYTVTNTGAGALAGITVTDPAVPAVSCPASSLAPGASETCKGPRIVTRADLAAGKITDTATASGTTANGVPVAAVSATVTVPRGWPPAVTGIYKPRPHQAEGYYLGVKGSTWSLIVTHPLPARKVIFTGTITLNAGAFRDVTRVDLESYDILRVRGRTLTFDFKDYGDLDGVQFTTTPANTKITFTLDIGGHPAAASQLYLGNPPAHPATHSPLTYTR